MATVIMVTNIIATDIMVADIMVTDIIATDIMVTDIMATDITVTDIMAAGGNHVRRLKIHKTDRNCVNIDGDHGERA